MHAGRRPREDHADASHRRPDDIDVRRTACRAADRHPVYSSPGRRTTLQPVRPGVPHWVRPYPRRPDRGGRRETAELITRLAQSPPPPRPRGRPTDAICHPQRVLRYGTLLWVYNGRAGEDILALSFIPTFWPRPPAIPSCPRARSDCSWPWASFCAGFDAVGEGTQAFRPPD